MDSEIKKKKPSNEGHIVIINGVSDTAKRLEEELKRRGCRVSLTNGHDAHMPSLTGDAILKIIREDDADLLILQQQKNSVPSVRETDVSRLMLARDRLTGDYSEIVGESLQIFEVLQQIDDIAATHLKVLILGKTGTGKGVVARALHKNSGRAGEMVSINCAAIPENLLESELFGHERGAFTSANKRHIGKFERAHNGTLFLDEITEMPLPMQPKLLRAIEEGEIERIGGKKPITVDVRVVAATNRDIAQAVKGGMFREDLYYRLNVASISLPTLYERKEDICVLVSHFLEKYCQSSSSQVLQISPDTRVLLETYPWPGNVRELENTIERVSYLIKGGMLLPKHLPKKIQTYQKQSMNISEEIAILENRQSVSVPVGTTLKAMEETLIRKTLAWFDGNRTKTARALGIGIRTLQRKLKKYNIF